MAVLTMTRVVQVLLFARCLAFAQPTETLVPMRDGVKLATDLYFPKGPLKDLPVVLERTPYNKKIIAHRARYWAARGYVFAAQDVRGRFRSEGKFQPYLREGPDGYDSIEWLASQPWSSGKVGTIGSSYAGLVQWHAAVEQPPHLTAMVVKSASPEQAPYDQGPFEYLSELTWFYILHHQKPEHDSPWAALENIESAYDPNEDLDLPIAGLDEKVFGRVDENWRRLCAEGPESDYWKPARYLSKVDRITAPALHISGWFDGDGLGTKLNYLAMKGAGAKNQRLILGPWGHADFGQKQRGRDFGKAALVDLDQESERWLAHWLKGEAAPSGEPVRLFVMGENRWMTAASYPSPGSPKRYFLGSKSSLLPDRGDDDLGGDHYVYDPGDPTSSPFTLSDEMESKYASFLAERKDILAYRSAPVRKPFKILGPMSAVVHLSADAPETDLFVRISEVNPSRGHFLLAEGKARVRFQGTKPVRVEVDLLHTAIRIAKGNRLAVDIASASYPWTARNLNTGENSLTGTEYRKANVTVHRSPEFPSFIEFSAVTETRR